MSNRYDQFKKCFRESYNDNTCDLMNNSFWKAREENRNYLLSETTNLHKDAFFTYKTPFYGNVPILHIYKNDMLQFIENVEQGKDCELYFISDPITDYLQICCSKWMLKNNKFYFTEYEDGHSAFCDYYVDMSNDIVDKLKIIASKIPDNVDDILNQLSFCM